MRIVSKRDAQTSATADTLVATGAHPVNSAANEYIGCVWVEGKTATEGLDTALVPVHALTEDGRYGVTFILTTIKLTRTEIRSFTLIKSLRR